nr:MAG TPA: hypothetical protein [Caudoviricetes sp.]
MIITGMEHFQSVCKRKLVEWYTKNRPETPIDLYYDYHRNGTFSECLQKEISRVVHEKQTRNANRLIQCVHCLVLQNIAELQVS